MGLLSDPYYGSSKWVTVIMKLYYLFCFACYVAAIAWFVVLGNREFNNETYFSENALLPGLVTNEFNAEQSSKQFYNEFLQELEDKYSDTDEMPVPWLVAKMSQLHLEVYTHNFTLNSPLGHGQVFHGTNVYGILRAPRTSSLEALVVSAPYRSVRSHLKGTAAGIALMLSFAQFARPQKYWAKDIIFLVTCHEQLGMQAWLEAYHGISHKPGTFYTSLGSFWPQKQQMFDVGKYGSEKYLDPGRLKGRSGSIQAAINLEFHTTKIKYIEVKIEGLNGQLPNLDLPNLVHKLCVKSGIYHSFKNSYSWLRNRYNGDEWKDNFYTMLKMVITQIPGVPSGNHGLFHRFGIEAVTLEGREASDAAGDAPKAQSLQGANFYRLGVALESILRSLNNLLERFHQSFFFYLMAGTNRFVSIGQYMPSLCLLIAAMLLKSLALWVKIQKNAEQDEVKENDEKTSQKDNTSLEDNTSSKEKTSSENKTTLEENTSSKENMSVKEKTTSKEDTSSKENTSLEEKKKLKKKVTFSIEKQEDSTMSIVNIGINYLLVHFLGYAVMNSPTFFSYIGSNYGYKSEISVFYGLIASSIIISILAPLAFRYLRTGPLNYEELTLVNVMVLVELSTICLCVGMHNISLGLCVGALYTPLALVAGVSKMEGTLSNYKVYLSRVTCLLLHPLTILTIGSALYAKITLPEESMGAALVRGRDAACQLTAWTIISSTNSIKLILAARLIDGIGGGLNLALSAMTVGEISLPKIRGILTTLPTLMFNVGAIASYAAGGLCSYQVVNYINMGFCALIVCSEFTLMESPIYLVQKGNEKEALKSLRFYRGSSASDQELHDELTNIKNLVGAPYELAAAEDEVISEKPDQEKLKQQATRSKGPESKNLFKLLFTTKASRRALFTLVFLFVGLVFMGTLAITTYAGTFFLKAVPSMSPDLCSIILGTVNLMGTLVSMSVTDKLGRRVLLVTSSTMVCGILAALASQLAWSWGPEWVIPALMLLSCFCLQLGAAPVPGILIGEYFTPEVKSLATSIILIVMWSANFIILTIFTAMVANLGLGGTFFAFSVVAGIVAVFFFLIVPETSGLTTEEIQEVFSGSLFHFRSTKHAF